MDKYGRLQFNQDRSNPKRNTVALKAKDDSNAIEHDQPLSRPRSGDPKASSAGFNQGAWNTSRNRPISPKSGSSDDAIEEEEHGDSSYDSEYTYFD